MRSLLYNPALAALGPVERDRLTRGAAIKRLDRNETLVFAGESCPHVFSVLDGFFKLAAYTGGKEQLVDVAGIGDLMCDVEAVLDIPPALDIVAGTKAVVLGFDRETFLTALGDGPASELVRSLAQKLNDNRRIASDAPLQPVAARVAARILQLGEAAGRMRGDAIEIEVPLSQAEIGQLAGASRESACKTIGAFRRDGLVEMRGRRLRVLRPDLLEKLRCGELDAAPCR